jgi:hypothetical protein
MKSGSLLHHVTSPDHTTWPTASELLHAATVGGARSANLEATVGSITPRLEADLVVLDLRTVAFTPRNDLVYCENGASIDYVMVAGQIVVDHGQVMTVDEDALLEEFRGSMPELLQQWEVVEQVNRRFEPYVQSMHDTCAQRPLGFSRYSGDPRTWENPDACGTLPARARNGFLVSSGWIPGVCGTGPSGVHEETDRESLKHLLRHTCMNNSE